MTFLELYWRMRQHDWNLRPFDNKAFEGCYRRRCNALFFRKSFQQRRFLLSAVVLVTFVGLVRTDDMLTIVAGFLLGLVACLIANFIITDLFVKLPAFRHAFKTFARLRQRHALN